MYIKINEQNRVIMQITDKFAESMAPDNITSFTVKDIPVNIPGTILCFNPALRAFYNEKVEITEEQKEKAKARATAIKEKEAALKWFADNDWKVNKHSLGEWADDDERWIEYLTTRAEKRAQYDEAERILNETK